MKDYALELVSRKSGFDQKLNAMREYLQAFVLKILSQEGLFRTTAFVGGTALRFLYELPRFSEDLDFSHVKGRALPFEKIMAKLKSELNLSGYTIEIRYRDAKTVQYGFVKFQGLMREAGLSPLPSQVFSIKVERDTKPPPGAQLETRIVNKYFPIAFLSFDVGSLFAGKLHALLNRKYTKGRDFFDIGWYLSRWPRLEPNLILLQNALKQTGWIGVLPARDNWRDLIRSVVARADWKQVRQDVRHFLERPEDIDVFTKEGVLQLLK